MYYFDGTEWKQKPNGAYTPTQSQRVKNKRLRAHNRRTCGNNARARRK